MDEKKKDEVVVLTGVKTDQGELGVRLSETGVQIGTLGEVGPDTPEGAEVLELRGDGPVKQVVGTSRVSGPAKCNSADFRSGWERIFGVKREVAQA